MPIIAIAEGFSWYAVIRTHYLGNTIEESTWAFSYCLIIFSLVTLSFRIKGSLKYVVRFAAFSAVIYVLFMLTVDIPMYFHRWQADVEASKPLLSFADGIHDLTSRWVVTRDIKAWREEIPWMSLYFSVAVWTSLALCWGPNAVALKK